jgi:hypothetical protein
VDRRHEDVGGAVVAELDDQLGEVGLDRADALPCERFVEADLVGGQRLHLDRLGRAGGPHEGGDGRVGLSGVARPVDRATGCGYGLLEPLEMDVEVAQRVFLDLLPRLAQLLPVAELGDDGLALGADCLSGDAEVVAQLAVAE